VTTLAHSSDLAGSRRGGVAARRALVRWAWRMFRREWRQQLLVVTLLTVAVAAAIGSITLVHNATASVDWEFGSANIVVELDAANTEQLQGALAAAEKQFGTIDAVGHRSVVVPGSVDNVDFRAQDPNGAYAEVVLRSGRYPEGRSEVAVTDGVARLLRLEVGSTMTLGGVRRSVVGIVENPRKLSDEFALVSPSLLSESDHVSVIVSGSEDSVDSYVESLGPDRGAFMGNMIMGRDGPSDTLAIFSVVTVFLLLASLIAAAGFAVVAQRRLRQLGMIAAGGATQKHLRFVLVANGAIVGAFAAICGTVVGLAIWLAAAPTLESAVDHRIDRLSLPWGLIVSAALLAVFMATAAAWWPGRTVSRLPVVLALSGRPPRPRPARYSAIAAVALIAVGIGCLALSNRERAALIVAGIVSTILGCLLLGPLAIRVFAGGLAGRVSIAPRLALRDLVRYQARSGAALAAVTLALGIAATVAIIVSAEGAKKADEPVNLSDRQIRVYLGPPDARELTPTDVSARFAGLAAGARRLAAQLDGATVTPLRAVVRPGGASFVIRDTRVFEPVHLARRFDSPQGRKRYAFASSVYVATAAVLRYLGIDPATVAPGTDFLVGRRIRTERLVIPDFESQRDQRVANVQKIDIGNRLFGSDSARTPPTFVTLAGLRRHGWEQVPAGWLVESTRPLNADQIAEARDVAANAGFSVETRRRASSNARAMAIAMAAGGVLALAILAMTVGLIRSEGAGDLRTLTATGATPRIRRTLTAATAGSLALLGAVIGVAGAYVVLLATYHDDLHYLSSVPFLYLASAVVGVPLLAAAAGWLLAGREPPGIARTVLE
jgi:putative ABC transport system permease protein